MKIIKMNKIKVGSIILDNENIFLEKESISKIETYGKCEINLFNCNIDNLSVFACDNSEVTINYFNLIKKENSKININTYHSSKVIFNHNFKSNQEYNLEIITDFRCDNSSIIVNINGLNDGGKCTIDVNGYVKKAINDSTKVASQIKANDEKARSKQLRRDN